MNELKPCPLCGERDINVIHHSDNNEGQPLRSVSCSTCGIRVLGYSLDALNKWNNRPYENERKADAVRGAAEYLESHQSTSKTDYTLLNEFADKLEQGECLNTAEMSKKQVVREFLESATDTRQVSIEDMHFLLMFADVYFEGEK